MADTRLSDNAALPLMLSPLLRLPRWGSGKERGVCGAPENGVAFGGSADHDV